MFATCVVLDGGQMVIVVKERGLGVGSGCCSRVFVTRKKYIGSFELEVTIFAEQFCERLFEEYHYNISHLFGRGRAITQRPVASRARICRGSGGDDACI